jgi:heptaprenylglyceryl phosphate synthase
MPALFLFSKIDPLDNTRPDNIKQAIIMADTIFFEIIEDGAPRGKTKPKTDFLMTQIDQFNIPHITQ